MQKIKLTKETLLQLSQDESAGVRAGVNTFPVSACKPDGCPDSVGYSCNCPTNGCNTAQIGCGQTLAYCTLTHTCPA